MLAAVQAADHGWEYLTEQVLLEEFDHPDCDFERGSVGVFDGGTMVGFGGLVMRPGAGTVHEMRYRGAVHPDWRGRGIGGRLLDWAEVAAVPLHRERYQDLPLSLSGWCLASNAAAGGPRGMPPRRSGSTPTPPPGPSASTSTSASPSTTPPSPSPSRSWPELRGKVVNATTPTVFGMQCHVQYLPDARLVGLLGSE
jgi:GNAT superfamily N-acetyltransferase